MTRLLLPSFLTDSFMHIRFLEASETSRTESENGLFWTSPTNWDSWEWVREQKNI